MNPIKLLILDVDGVLTDGGLYFSKNGEEFKKFNAKDGLAIQLLTKSGCQVGIISTGRNEALVQHRANMLGIQKVFVGIGEKINILNEWCAELHIELANVAFIGDDLNDIACMQQVGIAACPADAATHVKKIVHRQLNQKGGEGCVREFIEIYFPEIFP